MKTTILIFVLLLSLNLASCSKQDTTIDDKIKTETNVENITTNTASIQEDNTVQPDRKMDIY
jgi:hypothetical protein